MEAARFPCTFPPFPHSTINLWAMQPPGTGALLALWLMSACCQTVKKHGECETCDPESQLGGEQYYPAGGLACSTLRRRAGTGYVLPEDSPGICLLAKARRSLFLSRAAFFGWTEGICWPGYLWFQGFVPTFCRVEKRFWGEKCTHVFPVVSDNPDWRNVSGCNICSQDMRWLFVRTSRTSVGCTHSGVSQSSDKGFSTLRNVGLCQVTPFPIYVSWEAPLLRLR